MKSSNIKVSFHAPLNANDTPDHTQGCRANKPDICKNCMTEGICAFVTADGICYSPSKAWKKQYDKLSKEVKDEAL